MDALKAVIALKRKAEEENSLGLPTKYIRRGELERLREEQDQKAQENTKADVVVASKENLSTEVSFSLYTRMSISETWMEYSHLPLLLQTRIRRNCLNLHLIFPMKRLYAGFGLEDSLFASLGSQTRIGV